VSQLLDSLQRRRQPIPAPGSRRRTAQRDAVLATLGYAPLPSGTPLRSWLGRSALAAALGVAAFVGWTMHADAGAVRPVAAPRLVRAEPTPSAAVIDSRDARALLEALSVAPNSPPAHYNLAVLYEATGERSRAVEHYRAFIDTAGSEYADRVPAVRSRLAALAR
jgi:hypothetical protein